MGWAGSWLPYCEVRFEGGGGERYAEKRGAKREVLRG